MNSHYWAEKQKNQTQMLRVIHDQMAEANERINIHSGRIEVLVERIDILSDAIVKLVNRKVQVKK